MNEVVTSSAPRQHAIYSPSNSERFFNCPGSINMIAKVPARASSSYSEEGTIAHAVLEAALQNGIEKVLPAILRTPYAFNPICKGYTDFHGSIQDALDYIYDKIEYLDLMYGDVVVEVERRVNPPSHVAPDEVYGYCDVTISSAKGGVLYVIDYKHGVGVIKAAEGNTQVKQYAAGVLYGPDSYLRLDAAAIHTVVLVIIQPRVFHRDGQIREHTTTPLEIVDYLVDMDLAIERTQERDAPLNPGMSWCQFCEARSSCPALARSAVAAILNDANKDVQDLTQASLPNIKGLDVARMAFIVSMAPMIKQWLKGVIDHADELSRLGYNVPGFKRVATRAQRKYDFSKKPIDKVAEEIANLIGCPVSEVLKEPELLGIGDMENKIVDAFKARVGRGKKKQAAESAADMFSFFTVKESSGNTTLVPLDDSRPAVDKAQAAFGSISGLITPPPTTTGETR